MIGDIICVAAVIEGVALAFAAMAYAAAALIRKRRNK